MVSADAVEVRNDPQDGPHPKAIENKKTEYVLSEILVPVTQASNWKERPIFSTFILGNFKFSRAILAMISYFSLWYTVAVSKITASQLRSRILAIIEPWSDLSIKEPQKTTFLILPEPLKSQETFCVPVLIW